MTEDELTDGEFPGVGGSDGNGSDDEEEATDDEFSGVGGSDGNGSDDDEEATNDEFPSVGGSDGNYYFKFLSLHSVADPSPESVTTHL